MMEKEMERNTHTDGKIKRRDRKRKKQEEGKIERDRI